MREELDNIINCVHHEPDHTKHPRMSLYNRAAQFAPFAALDGFEDQVEETARLTKSKIELNPEQKKSLNNSLYLLTNKLEADHSLRPLISVTYFKKDNYKKGGAYITICEELRNINNFEQKLHLVNDLKIPIEDLFSVQIIDD